MVEAHAFSLAHVLGGSDETDLQTVSFAAHAMRIMNRARLSVNGLYSITGVDWLIAADINFSSTTALRFADLEELPSNVTRRETESR